MNNNTRQQDSPLHASKSVIETIRLNKALIVFWILYLLGFAGLGCFLGQNDLPGTGVANYVASERAVKGLVLLAPYADGYDLYNSFVDIFYGPMRMLVVFKMESIQFASAIAVKPLILASKADEMIPFASSERLSEAYPDGCETVWFEDLRHNDFWSDQQTYIELKEYLETQI